ncbi:hypothetical protein GMORB2_4722 [Geosmithia morbida]|uniref:F-box domain-containing protein n=1 Tax=Geosmithia morbida TaxID=1094350 RepID=A0A9P4YN13_9HYPO|nr:uncharacterized protein GMORB2_4722 [Geosmithia morbida]KAF4119457.1 hypothetical protein GMORB2_4722 [Geosmithia morbida]
MQIKRRLSCEDDNCDAAEDYISRSRLHKRICPSTDDSIISRPPVRDTISTLPAEILVRILSFLGETTLLEISTVSRLFHRVTADQHLWRLHYYRRFILPRAHLIPGFRKGAVRNGSSYSSSRASRPEPTSRSGDSVDWKQSYKLLHNWARGRCDVEELQIHPREPMMLGRTIGRTLVKVVEGLAITADVASGLMVWDLRTRSPVAQTGLEPSSGCQVHPTCLAVDDELLSQGGVGIAAGFDNGTFGVWRMDLANKQLIKLCRHSRGPQGRLEAIAYCQPYVLAASTGGYVAVWTLDAHWHNGTDGDATKAKDARAPHMVRSLRSHSTRAPLTLSMRRVSLSVIASIVYTLDTVGGWCIGIQDFDIRPSLGDGPPEIVDSRIAHTVPTPMYGARAQTAPAMSPPNGRGVRHIIGNEDHVDDGDDQNQNSVHSTPPSASSLGPICLCYNHPYLLATLPDNTLLLHLCTTTSTRLTISPGTRLWGHTSGISDAEITARGKAVSVSARGDEIRVWELEGRAGGCSVEVRPRQQDAIPEESSTDAPAMSTSLDFKKNKVGFDEEMVIVLKEALDGRESLMVYDFT